MSIFEWFFERNNPGPTGSIETYHHKLYWPRIWIIIAGGAALAAVLIFIYYIPFNQFEDFENGAACLGIFFSLVYLVVSYYIYIKPDYNNMGFLGFIDNPFKYTDDVNRFMLFFQALLLPGKIISIPITNLFSLLFTIRKADRQ
ncbi:hypothetical protein J7E50_16940 [Pedobacter sp. ISL-68]|uniref:hypothetical protein n=1 Tax=unclassified Pedobacter TaxID=2628915 RepID=UPI001BEB61B1|nr:MULTISPECIES: hypothetical protein [unclassified Pedobacter]MBT2559610.1 hypothetical protein [Pedobacter sp. ISL-64]MBT2591915.1 hypothetical protein [Pedobacter sp. ISL-68]